jgi:hypothetical protein
VSQKIGPREAALRAQREASTKPVRTVRDVIATMTKLPKPSGKKPIKRKTKKKS